MSEYMAEELFLKVEKLFESGEFAEGRKVLEEILEMEPGFGRAHNHLGWLYYVKLDNYSKAEYHYKLARKFAPEYPAGYINLSFLLVATGRYDEARANAREALAVPAMNRAVMFNELGRIEELSGNYREALAHYRDAVRVSLNKNEMAVYNENIERVRTKTGMFSRKFSLF